MEFDTFNVDKTVLRKQGLNLVDLGGDFANASKWLQDTLKGMAPAFARVVRFDHVMP